MTIEARQSLKNRRFEDSKLSASNLPGEEIGRQFKIILEANELSTWIHGGVCLCVICLHILENHRHKYRKEVDSEGTELAFRIRV
jgi:hypothetical protein